MLKTAQSAIVDEIHAVAPNKRGIHLAFVAGKARGFMR